MLFRKMHCHVWNTFILLAFLLSSCCLSPVEDEVVIDVCQDVSMETVSIVNVIDTFYRRSPEFFFANSVMFDKEPRGKFLLHSHGYACKVDSGNMLASLAEAAWYLGMERNRDLVRINLDSLAVKNENDSKLSSDYARAISVGNIPTYNVQISKTQSVPLPVKTEKGMIGFGSWGTEVEFKDIRIEADGKTTFYDVSCCKADSGEWKVQDGVLIQTSRQLRTRAILPDFIGNEYVLTFRARRTRGDEGLFLYYGVSADGKKGYCVNVGRWTNQFINIEDLEGEVVTKILPWHLKNNRWYDVKLVSTSEGVEFYVNERLVIGYKPVMPRQFYAAGYDEKTGETVVKVVNSADVPYKVRFHLVGGARVEAEGRVLTLAAATGMDENTAEEPKRIYPRESEFREFGEQFDYEFLPFSYTVMRIKTQKR